MVKGKDFSIPFTFSFYYRKNQILGVGLVGLILAMSQQ